MKVILLENLKRIGSIGEVIDVKRGFARTSAESTAYVILAQAKIDNISPQSILDKLSGVTDIQLSELITIILNANRYKSSRLGVRQTLTTKETVSRNIID